MKLKVLLIVAVFAGLVLTSVAQAGGDKNRGDKGKGNTHRERVEND